MGPPRDYGPTRLLLALLLFILITYTKSHSHPKKELVCKKPGTQNCLTWTIFLEDLEWSIIPVYCGVSDKATIASHRPYIEITKSEKLIPYKKLFCYNVISEGLFYTWEEIENVIGIPLRVRRQTFIPRGRYRGQTQSQYLTIDRGNNEDEGRAEALSAADSSRASVSGNSGMGQAQSQSIYDPNCDDCYGKPNHEIENLKRPVGSKPGEGSNGLNSGSTWPSHGGFRPTYTNGGGYNPSETNQFTPGQKNPNLYGPVEGSYGVVGKPSDGNLQSSGVGPMGQETIGNGNYKPNGIASNGYSPIGLSGSNHYKPSDFQGINGYTPMGRKDTGSSTGPNSSSTNYKPGTDIVGGRYIPSDITGGFGGTRPGAETNRPPGSGFTPNTNLGSNRGPGGDNYVSNQDPIGGRYDPRTLPQNGNGQYANGQNRPYGGSNNYGPGYTYNNNKNMPGVSGGSDKPGGESDTAPGLLVGQTSGQFGPGSGISSREGGFGPDGRIMSPNGFGGTKGTPNTNWPLASGPYSTPGGNVYCCVIPNNVGSYGTSNPGLTSSGGFYSPGNEGSLTSPHGVSQQYVPGTNGDQYGPGGTSGHYIPGSTTDSLPGGPYGQRGSGSTIPGEQYGPGGLGGISGGSVGPTVPGGQYAPGGSSIPTVLGGQYEPGVLGGTTGPGGQYRPGISGGSTVPGGQYGPGVSGGTTRPVGQYGPGSLGGTTVPGGQYGPGVSGGRTVPGGQYGPGVSGGTTIPGGQYGPGSSRGPTVSGGQYGPGVSGGTTGPGGQFGPGGLSGISGPGGQYKPGGSGGPSVTGGQYGPGGSGGTTVPAGQYTPGGSGGSTVPGGQYGPGSSGGTTVPAGQYGPGSSGGPAVPGGQYGPSGSGTSTLPGGQYGLGGSGGPRVPGGQYGLGGSGTSTVPGGKYGPGGSGGPVISGGQYGPGGIGGHTIPGGQYRPGDLGIATVPGGQYGPGGSFETTVPGGQYRPDGSGGTTVPGGQYGPGGSGGLTVPGGQYGPGGSDRATIPGEQYGPGGSNGATVPGGQYRPDGSGGTTFPGGQYGPGGSGGLTVPGGQYGPGGSDRATIPGQQYGPGGSNGATVPRGQYGPGGAGGSTGPGGQYGPGGLGGTLGPGGQYRPGVSGGPTVPGAKYGPGGSGGPGGDTVPGGQYVPGDTSGTTVPEGQFGPNGVPFGAGGYKPGYDRGISGSEGGPGNSGVPFSGQEGPDGSYYNQRIPTEQKTDYNGVPQNYLDPNSVSADGDDSEAEANVAQTINGTTASASSKGGNNKGRAQTSVQGTYTGSGSFQAQAQISGENKGAQSEVSGGKKGASSSATGNGKNNKSQANVQLGSETGSVQTQSQSNGIMHSSNSQVQGSVKGGMADAQARGPGSTSSQAQIGFTPYKDDDKTSHDLQRIPFTGGGMASAQSSGRTGQSQSQLHGTFKYGITYNGAAQSGASLDKDTVFPNRLSFEKIDVFDHKNKNINVNKINADTTEISQSSNTETPTSEISTTLENFETKEITELPVTDNVIDESMKNSESRYSSHTHLDHHTTDPSNATYSKEPAILGNRRSFTTNYGMIPDYEFTTDKDETQPEYDTDVAFESEGNEANDVEQNEYSNYDEYSRDTHQYLQNSNKKGLEVQQTTGGNTQHIILGSLKDHNAEIIQKDTERPDESKVYQPGERVPGTGGYTIPIGFTGSVKSVASKDKTYVVGSQDSPSQAQSVTLTPGTGKIKYMQPSSYGKYVKPKNLRSLKSTKENENNRYLSVSKSVTRDLDSDNNIRKQYSHTYYTKSSSCGYFTFTCTMVSSAEGRKKVCKPKIPTNPDGTPIRC